MDVLATHSFVHSTPAARCASRYENRSTLSRVLDCTGSNGRLIPRAEPSKLTGVWTGWIAALAVTVVSRSALPCVLASDPEFVAAPTGADQTPPTPVDVARVTISRHEVDDGCRGGGSSCGAIATLAISVRATDDTTPPDELGYRVTSATGEILPVGLGLYDRRAPGGTLSFYFSSNSDPLDFELAVQAIDTNGNVGPPTIVSVVEDVEDGACASSSPAVPPVILALAALGLALRRRGDHDVIVRHRRASLGE